MAADCAIPLVDVISVMTLATKKFLSILFSSIECLLLHSDDSSQQDVGHVTKRAPSKRNTYAISRITKLGRGKLGIKRNSVLRDFGDLSEIS